MGKLDRSLWQWSIRRPGTLEWRIMGRCLTETEARQWAITNGYEIRREAEVDGAVRESENSTPPRAAAPGKRRRADTSPE
ncbi:MAG: hypothetical protein ACM3SS_00190 [Rhodospirillaceae bacterium]